MTNIPPGITLENVPLTPKEHRLIQTLRLLQQADPVARLQVEEFIWSLVGRQLHWSFDDPASLDRAAAFAALDPTQRREMDAIEADFAAAESDGLEAP
jgi:hypothetical protein